jgi:phosphatidylserine/phosphatidylglycerophosphate/cardiolipin synthase-like enzyme
MKLIVEPGDGAGPLLAAIKGAKKSVEIAIFRFDRADIEKALKAAAERGVKVTVLIASANRGGEQRLRRLESRCLAAGIIVARTADDLARYHNKYMLIDRRVLYMLSFNFTHLDIDHSRGFGIVSTQALWVGEATRLFRADCTRTKFRPKTETFVVSPENARSALDTFLKRAKMQLLIYDPRISDKDLLRVLHERSKAGIEVRVIGSVAGRSTLEAQKLAGSRLHTRTIIRDRKQAFIGSQSLRAEELDSRRELGLILHDAKVVKTLIDTFEADWTSPKTKKEAARSTAKKVVADEPAVSEKDAEKAVRVLTKELDPLAANVKKAVKNAVAESGEGILHDKDIEHTMKQVVKKAAKAAVKEAVQDAQDAEDAQDAKETKDAKSQT